MKNARILLKIVLLCAGGLLAVALYVGLAGIPRPFVRQSISRIEKAHGVRIAIDRVTWLPWHRLTAHGVRVSAPRYPAAVRFETVTADVGQASSATSGRRQFVCSVTDGHLRVSACDGREPVSVTIKSGTLERGSDACVRFRTAVAPLDTHSFMIRGHFEDRADGRYECRLESDVAPQVLAAFLPTNIAPFVASLAVAGASHTEVSIHGHTAGRAMDRIEGNIYATDVTRNQVPADLLHASFSYSNTTFQVEDLALVRGDGCITGAFEYRPSDRFLSVNVRSTVPVPDAAGFIGFGLDQVVAVYTFDGPATVECRGTLGLKGNPVRDMRLLIDGKRLGWRWFMADDAVLKVSLREQATVVEDLTARWCYGTVTGSLLFDRTTATNVARRCRMDLVVAEADLASVVHQFRDIEDAKPYDGMLSGQVELTGIMGSNFLATATGSGRIDIQDGYILSIPIFGGLSKYLSLLIPGLGYANQRDMRGSFVVRNGRIESTRAELLGKVITVRGKGSYAFNGDINARVQVQFLKEGLTATVTRLITSPLTKALEFELTGTTKEPRWRPVNTPARLLKFFSAAEQTLDRDE